MIPVKIFGPTGIVRHYGELCLSSGIVRQFSEEGSEYFHLSTLTSGGARVVEVVNKPIEPVKEAVLPQIEAKKQKGRKAKDN